MDQFDFALTWTSFWNFNWKTYNFWFISGSNKEEAGDSKTEARTTQQANQRAEGKAADLQSVHLNRLLEKSA